MNQLTTSLWGDESFTAIAVQEKFWPMLQIVAKDTAPPLYYILLFIWTRMFGASEPTIRSLSLLLYLGTAYLVFLIAKKVWNKKTGFLALWLILSNPFLFPFAFEGRMYAIMVFTVTLSFYFFIKSNFWGYILAAAAALYSHHYAILAVFPQFCWRLFNAKNLNKEWFKLIKPYLLIGLLYLPWIYPLYNQLSLVSTGFWLTKPKLADLPLLLAKYLIGSQLIFSGQKLLLLFPFLILFLKKWRLKLKKNLLLLTWVLTPIFLAFCLSQGKASLFFDRYLIFIIPGLVLLLSSDWRRLSLVLIIFFSLPLVWVNYYYFTHPTKRPFRQLANYVKSNIEPGDFLINYNGKAHHLWETKYYGLEAPLFVSQGELPYYVGTAQMKAEDIIRDLPQKEKIGVISSEPPETMILPNYKYGDCQQFQELYFCWFNKQ